MPWSLRTGFGAWVFLVVVGAVAHPYPALAQPGAELIANLSREPALAPGFLLPGSTAGERALFVVSEDPGTYVETTLWTSDGTDAGTSPYYRFCRFQGCTAPTFFTPAFGGVFLVVPWIEGGELWWSDGTREGLIRLFRGGWITELGLAEDAGLYFFASTHRTPTTTRTTIVSVDSSLGVVEIDERGGAIGPSPSASLDDAVLYVRPNGIGKWALWVADAINTRILEEWDDGAEGYPVGFDDFGLVLRAHYNRGTWDVWVSDGTRPGTQSLLEGVPFPTILGGGRLAYFSLSGELGAELWVSDGTPFGTRRLATFGELFEGVEVEGTFFFTASTASGSPQLWRTDGSVSGTRLVREINAERLVAFDSGIFFLAIPPGAASSTLWSADLSGRVEGPLVPDDVGSFPLLVPYRDGALIATDVDIWFSRGRTSTTERLAELPSRNQPVAFAVAGERVLFFVRDESGVAPPTLWSTDGTFMGTGPLSAPKRPADRGSSPRLLAQAEGGPAFVLADSRGFSPEVWRTDGTTEGTIPESELPTGIVAGKIVDGRLLAIDDRSLYSLEVATGRANRVDTFQGLDPSLGRVGSRVVFFARFDELLSSNGDGGTIRLASGLLPGGNGGQFLETARGLMIPVLLPTGEIALWLTDGFAGGTRELVNLGYSIRVPGRVQGRWWVTLGDRFYFLDIRSSLHRVDLVTGELVTLFDAGGIDDPSRYLESFELAVIGQRLLFVAPVSDPSDLELWISDGTPAGTRLLRDLWPGPIGSRPRELTELGGALYFSADHPGSGRELWRTDGTAVGTRRVADLLPGTPGSQPTALSVASGRLLFSANDGRSGSELWQSDGTEAGTVRLTDIAAGPAFSDPRVLTVVDGALLIAADDDRRGTELWRVAVEPSGACDAGPTRLCLMDGRLGVEVRWLDRRAGLVRDANATPFPGSDATGTFWFFAPDNVELLVKTLDGGALNGRLWVFYGALSDVEYWVQVEDFETGAIEEYHNPRGTLCGAADIDAFPSAVSSRARPDVSTATSRASDAGFGSSTELMLNGGRFRVEVDWHAPFTGASGAGQAIQGTDDSGFFWFFNAENVELAVKVLDARVVNDRFWVFFGALTDVEYRVTVTDRETGLQRVYSNPAGTLCGQADTNAF